MMESKTAFDESQLQCQGDGTKCAECGKLFSHVFYFGTHIVTHLGEKDYMTAGQCGMCGMVFSKTSVYEAHMLSLQSRMEAAENRSREEEKLKDQLKQSQQLPSSDGEKSMMDTSPSRYAREVEQDPHHQQKQEKQKQHHSALPKKASRQTIPEAELEESSQQPDSQAAVSEQKVKQKPPQPGPKSQAKPDVQDETQPPQPGPKSQAKPEVQDEAAPAPKADNTPSKVEPCGSSDPVTEELPKKRIRRAPDKYEIFPEAKKRRGPKRKPLPTPGCDPEVERYLQSLRDMGFSVAPDSFDVGPGSQMSRGGEPLARRGQGMPRGRGSLQTSFNSPPTRPMAHATKHVNDFGQGHKVSGDSYISSRGMMGMNDSNPKISPHALIRNSNQNFQSRNAGVASFQSKQVISRGSSNNDFRMGSMGSPMMAGRANQEFMKTPSSAGPAYHIGNQNRQPPMRMPPLSKPRSSFYNDDYEDEIAHLINGDLEVMPVSGKATRGERLRQRQERLSQEGADGSAKKSVKYFPRNEKSKAKRTSKRDSSPPNKRQRIASLDEEQPVRSRSPTPDDTSRSLAGQMEESSLQITNVHSLKTFPTARRSRGASARGRGGRWKSLSESSPTIPPQDQHHELEKVDFPGKVRNVAGKMEDLREEARKKVEEMLAAPGVFLDQTPPKSSNTFSRDRNGQRAHVEPQIKTGRPKLLLSPPRPKLVQVSSRGRGRLPSRFRGGAISSSSSSSSTARVGRDQVHQKQKSPALEPEDKLKDKDGRRPGDECDSENEKEEDDKDEIVDGADIDGWTVSISKMSDSEGEDNTGKDNENIGKNDDVKTRTERKTEKAKSEDKTAAEVKPVSDIEGCNTVKESSMKEHKVKADAKDEITEIGEEDGMSEDIIHKNSWSKDFLDKPDAVEEIKDYLRKSPLSVEQGQDNKKEISCAAASSKLSPAPTNDGSSNQEAEMKSADGLSESETPNLVCDDDSRPSTKFDKDFDAVGSSRTESQPEEVTPKDKSVTEPRDADCQSEEESVKSNVVDSKHHKLPAEKGSERDSDSVDSKISHLQSDHGVEEDINDALKTDPQADKKLCNEKDLANSDNEKELQSGDRLETRSGVTDVDEISEESSESVKKCDKTNVQCDTGLEKDERILNWEGRNAEGQQDEKVRRLDDLDNKDLNSHKKIDRIDGNASIIASKEYESESDQQTQKDADTMDSGKTDRHLDLEMEKDNAADSLKRDFHSEKRKDDATTMRSDKTDSQSDQGVADNVMAYDDSDKTDSSSYRKMETHSRGHSDNVDAQSDQRIKGSSAEDSCETDVEYHKQIKDNLETTKDSGKTTDGIDSSTVSKNLSAEKGSVFEPSLESVCEKDHLETVKESSEKCENILSTSCSRDSMATSLSSSELGAALLTKFHESEELKLNSSSNESTKLVGGCGDKNEDATKFLDSEFSVREKECENDLVKSSICSKHELDHEDEEKDRANSSLGSNHHTDTNLAMGELQEESSSASVKECRANVSSEYPSTCSANIENDSEKTGKSKSESSSENLSHSDLSEMGKQYESTNQSDSSNMFDETDNFSEIEKTCRQII